MNKGRLSKQEKYCIEQMNKEGKSISEIAEFLDRTEKVVENNLPKLEKPETNAQKEKKQNSTHFVNRTAGKKNKGVSIMTETESSRSDDTRSKNQSIINRYKSAIHMISDQEDNG